MNFSGSALILGLLVLAILVYRLNRIPGSYGLLALRLGGCLCLGLILSGWIVRVSTRSWPHPGILCLVDISPSMAEELREVGEVLGSKIETSGSVEYWGFADSIYPLASPTRLEVRGDRTDLTRALRFAQIRSPGRVLLITDGHHTGSSDPAQVAATLGVPLSLIGVGREVVPDMRLERVLGPSQVYLGDTVRIRVRYSSQGFDHGTTGIELREGGEVKARKEVKLSPRFTEGEVEFELLPATPGYHRYLLTSGVVPGEEETENNRLEYGLRVIKTRMRVLYLSNRPTFNHRFLISALRDEPGIELTRVVAFRSEEWKELSNGMMPYSPPGRLDCDVLILDNPDIRALPARVTALIEEFAQRGGVLVLGGEGFSPGGLAHLLPGRPVRVRSEEVCIRLTPAGLATPLFYFNNVPIFTQFPPLEGWVECTARSDALVWAEGPGQEPLILFGRNQRGRVLQINPFPFWRLGFLEVGLGRSFDPFKRLVINLCRFLSLTPEEFFILTTDKPSYRAGEEVLVRVDALSPQWEPLSGLDVQVSVPGLDLSIPLVEKAPGRYEGGIEGMRPGSYRLVAKGELDSRVMGEAQTQVLVLHSSVEDLAQGQNRVALNRIAAVAGTQVLQLDSVKATGLKLPVEPRHRVIQFIPQLSPWLYLLFVALFGLELVLRKSRGLP